MMCLFQFILPFTFLKLILIYTKHKLRRTHNHYILQDSVCFQLILTEERQQQLIKPLTFLEGITHFFNSF